jgi:putative PIN family toxin of toxin-antitoxin system
VSGVLFRRGNPSALRHAWERRAVGLVTSTAQRDELHDVLTRPAVAGRYGLTHAERDALFRRIDDDGEFVAPLTTLPLPVRDVDDEPILGTALAARADYLVTGDKDLLVLAGDPRLGALKIVTVAEFLAILTERESEEKE